jgi:hypothetical protein
MSTIKNFNVDFSKISFGSQSISKLLVSAILLLSITFTSFSQNNDNFQAYLVHRDEVKPSMSAEYEKLAKEYKAACEKHSSSESFSIAETADGSIMSISPIEKLGDIDNGNDDLREKMGADTYATMMKNFNKCYDNHGSYVVLLNKELSYMPNGIQTAEEGKNYRKWHFLYTTPENKAALGDKLKDIKKMFADKNSKMHYRVYQNGFGQMDEYFLVVVSAKDELEYAQMSAENQKLLGPEAKPYWDALMKSTSRYEETTGRMRPDLGYTSKQ